MIKRIEWIVKGRMIVVELFDIIDMNDIETIIRQARLMVETEGEPPFSHILDVRQREAIMPDVLNLKRLRNMMVPVEMIGWTLFVDPHPHKVLNSILSILMQIMNSRLRMFATMQDAMTFIYAVDETLPGRKEELI